MTPNPALKPGRAYTILLPKHSVRYLTQDFSFSFSTRFEDRIPPKLLHSFPSATLPRMDLDPIAPFALFSEGVAGVP